MEEAIWDDVRVTGDRFVAASEGGCVGGGAEGETAAGVGEIGVRGLGSRVGCGGWVRG